MHRLPQKDLQNRNDFDRTFAILTPLTAKEVFTEVGVLIILPSSLILYCERSIKSVTAQYDAARTNRQRSSKVEVALQGQARLGLPNHAALQSTTSQSRQL